MPSTLTVLTPESAARFAATHALLLLAAAVLLLLLAFGAVVLAARYAGRYGQVLWRVMDALQPGPLSSSFGYLATHLALALMLLGALGGFVALADEVFEPGGVGVMDRALARALHEELTPEWEARFRTLTWFGKGEVLTAGAAGILGVLLVRRRLLLALTWVLGMGGGALLNYALKAGFSRRRPEFASPDLLEASWSFPSGHAMMTFIFCGLGAYLLWRTLPTWHSRGLLVVIVLAWSLVMGFSRIYLGEHYLSDVLAGYLAGTAWVAACVSGSEVALRRRRGRETR